MSSIYFYMKGNSYVGLDISKENSWKYLLIYLNEIIKFWFLELPHCFSFFFLSQTFNLCQRKSAYIFYLFFINSSHNWKWQHFFFYFSWLEITWKWWWLGHRKFTLPYKNDAWHNYNQTLMLNITCAHFNNTKLKTNKRGEPYVIILFDNLKCTNIF